MIAMSLLCEPDLLIADEPTTALDVTVQAQILDLLRDIRGRLNTATIIITHDFGVIAGLCDRVLVMYAGQIVEKAGVRGIFYTPQHPYSAGLLGSIPRFGEDAIDLPMIPGQPPNLQLLPAGCSFRTRCAHAHDICGREAPVLRPVGESREKACHLESLP